jgi:hypothetical protein
MYLPNCWFSSNDAEPLGLRDSDKAQTIRGMTPFLVRVVTLRFIQPHATAFSNKGERPAMKLATRIRETAATGWILLWLLGIPVPILLIFFLLRGCT